MIIVRLRNITFLVALLAAGVPVVTQSTTDGYQFAGFYQVSDVNDLVSEVAVTLDMEIFNYSGMDVYDGTIALADWLVEEEYGSFSAIYIAHRESTRVENDFVI